MKKLKVNPNAKRLDRVYDDYPVARNDHFYGRGPNPGSFGEYASRRGVRKLTHVELKYLAERPDWRKIAKAELRRLARGVR